MKTLIVYRSQHGTTAKAAKYLQNRLGEDTTDLHELSGRGTIDFNQYESILIGGSIHAGSIQRKIKTFCTKHLADLLDKKVGLFMCFMDMAHGDCEFDNAFPEKLREHAIAKGLFGGEYIFEKMNFIEKMIIKKITGKAKTESNLNYDAMDAFADTIRKVEA